MLSIRVAESIGEPEQEVASVPEQDEFEIVLGRRQVASVLFVATVIVAVFSAVSYLTGKSMSPKNSSVVVAAVPPPPQNAVPPPAPKAAPHAVEASEAPLFAEPVVGAVYLQMGAVEKGIAAIFAEGLRTHGFRAFAAPGPNDHIFRVLIGPLPDAEAFASAKIGVDMIGLSTFARKFQQ